MWIRLSVNIMCSESREQLGHLLIGLTTHYIIYIYIYIYIVSIDTFLKLTPQSYITAHACMVICNWI